MKNKEYADLLRAVAMKLDMLGEPISDELVQDIKKVAEGIRQISPEEEQTASRKKTLEWIKNNIGRLTGDADTEESFATEQQLASIIEEVGDLGPIFDKETLRVLLEGNGDNAADLDER